MPYSNSCNSPEKTEGDDEASAYSNLYKYTGRTMEFTQEQHRQQFLKRQKEKRTANVDEKRDLSDLFSEESCPMECQDSNTRYKLVNKQFKNKMMGSEWFTEIPEDLSENWICKICPEGMRYLVVAHKGKTACYLRNGRMAYKFKSNLPGGSEKTPGHRFTVLDCIYNKSTNIYFVYDVLAWNNLSLIDSEASMRFSWLKSKFEDDTMICTTNHKNISFMLIDSFPARKDIIQDQMFIPFMVNDSQLPLDGILFYHKEGHYVFGKSPLVGWLKPFMLTELLHIDVHPDHLHAKPKNYVSFQQYIDSKKKFKKMDRNKNLEKMMELESVEEAAAVESIDCDNL